MLEDIDDEEDVYSVPAATGGSSNSAPSPSRLFESSSVSSNGFASIGGGSSMAGLQPLLPQQQCQLSKLLWGDELARPDAAWQQGLVFADTPGLGWGLLQLAGEARGRSRSRCSSLVPTSAYAEHCHEAMAGHLHGALKQCTFSA